MDVIFSGAAVRVEGSKVKVMSVLCKTRVGQPEVSISSLIGICDCCAVGHMRYSLLYLSSAANGIHFLMGETLHLRSGMKTICVQSCI